MQFLVFTSNRQVSESRLEELNNCFLRNLSIPFERLDYRWQSSDNKTAFLGANPALNAYQRYKTFDITDDGNLALVNGWAKFYDADSLIQANSLHRFSADELSPTKIDGHYLMARIDSTGSGFLTRSVASPCLYFCEKDGMTVLSNRASAIADVLGLTRINDQFVAHHIEHGDFYPFNDAIFEGIQVAHPGDVIQINGGKVVCNRRETDFLYDGELDARYKADKKQYWDDCYALLRSQVDAFRAAAFLDDARMGLTGGKDSRVLASLFHSDISVAYTSGPAYFSDVIIGKQVAAALGTPHQINNTFLSPEFAKNPLQHIPYHLFCREFETSPWDLWKKPPADDHEVNINGQEFGLRRRLKHVDINQQKLAYVARFSSRSLIRDVVARHIEQRTAEFHDALAPKLVELAKFDLIENFISRGARWVAKYNETQESYRLPISPLCSNLVSRFIYNASPAAISEEEFHYEIVLRAAPELLAIPLSRQRYSQADVDPLIDKMPRRVHLGNIFLLQNFELIKKYMLEEATKLDSFVDPQKIEELSSEFVRSPPGCIKVLNILQAIELYGTGGLQSRSAASHGVAIGEMDDSESSLLRYDQNFAEVIWQYECEVRALKASLNHASRFSRRLRSSAVLCLRAEEGYASTGKSCSETCFWPK